MRFTDLEKHVKRVSLGHPFMLWDARVWLVQTKGGVALGTSFENVPDRNSGETTRLYSQSVVYPLKAFKTKFDVFKWVKCEFMRQLEHELEEALWYGDKRMMDPHRPSWARQTKTDTKRSQSCIKIPA